MMMLSTSLDPKPNAINGPQCKIWRTWPWLCSFNTSSATFPVQWDSVFCGRMVEKFGAEGIPPNQFSNGLQCERFESAKARTGSRFGTAVQIQKGANEDHTLKSLEFVSQSLYLKDSRKKIKRLLVKPATVRISACVRHSCMHLQKSLRTQHLKWLRKCADQFCIVQDRLEQGARLGQLCRYKRERTKITRSSRWSLCCKVCTWKTPGRRSSGSWWSRQPCVSALV